MRNALDVVISGTSAGGLAVYLHTDYLNKKISSAVVASGNPKPRIVAVPDAGFFLDVPSIGGEYTYTPVFKSVFHFQNVSDSVNDACVAFYSRKIDSHGDNESWKCFMSPYTLPFIRTPLFIVNSFADSWQGWAIMGLQCDPTSKSAINRCDTKEIEYLNSFRVSMLESSLGTFVRSPGSGTIHLHLHLNFTL